MLKRYDNRIQKFVMRYSATYPSGVVCRKKWGSWGVKEVIKEGVLCEMRF
jgi:hypothetical protein